METLKSWWKKQWKGANNPQTGVHPNQKKASGMEPAKAPDEADIKLDITCVDGDDRSATTRDKEDLSGQHVLHNTKYGYEDLVGVKTNVSTVKGTREEKVQTVEALADSGASASIISWDLAKKVNMIVFEKWDSTLRNKKQKHMDVSGRGEIRVQ